MSRRAGARRRSRWATNRVCGVFRRPSCRSAAPLAAVHTSNCPAHAPHRAAGAAGVGAAHAGGGGGAARRRPAGGLPRARVGAAVMRCRCGVQRRGARLNRAMAAACTATTRRRRRCPTARPPLLSCPRPCPVVAPLPQLCDQDSQRGGAEGVCQRVRLLQAAAAGRLEHGRRAGRGAGRAPACGAQGRRAAAGCPDAMCCAIAPSADLPPAHPASASSLDCQVKRHLEEGHGGEAPAAMRFPMSLGPPRIDADHQGKPCLGAWPVAAAGVCARVLHAHVLTALSHLHLPSPRRPAPLAPLRSGRLHRERRGAGAVRAVPPPQALPHPAGARPGGAKGGRA